MNSFIWFVLKWWNTGSIFSLNSTTTWIFNVCIASLWKTACLNGYIICAICRILTLTYSQCCIFGNRWPFSKIEFSTDKLQDQALHETIDIDAQHKIEKPAAAQNFILRVLFFQSQIKNHFNTYDKKPVPTLSSCSVKNLIKKKKTHRKWHQMR